MISVSFISLLWTPQVIGFAGNYLFSPARSVTYRGWVACVWFHSLGSFWTLSQGPFHIITLYFECCLITTGYFTRHVCCCQYYVFLFSVLFLFCCGCEVSHNFSGCICVWSQISKTWMWLCKEIGELVSKKKKSARASLGSISDMVAEITLLTLEICFQILTWLCSFLKWLYPGQQGNRLGTNLPETHLPKWCSRLLRAGTQRGGND